MTPREFSSWVLGRAVDLLIHHKAEDMPTAKRLAARELGKMGVKVTREPRPAPAPRSAGHTDNEEAFAKELLFSRLAAYFARVDKRRAEEKAAKRAARKMAKAAKPVPAAARIPSLSNVIPLHRSDVRPDPPLPEFTGPLVYGALDGQNEPLPVGVAAVNRRISIQRNEAISRRNRGET
jgi:hypothetical protein